MVLRLLLLYLILEKERKANRNGGKREERKCYRKLSCIALYKILKNFYFRQKVVCENHIISQIFICQVIILSPIIKLSHKCKDVAVKFDIRFESLTSNYFHCCRTSKPS